MMETLSQFFYMGGHGFYVWSAYGMATLLLVGELVFLRRRRKQAIERLMREARADRTARDRNV